MFESCSCVKIRGREQSFGISFGNDKIYIAGKLEPLEIRVVILRY